MRQQARDFGDIAEDIHRQCYVPHGQLDTFRARLRQSLLKRGLSEVELSVPENQIWAQAYDHGTPVRSDAAAVIIDYGGYRDGDRPVLRVAVRRRPGHFGLFRGIVEVVSECFERLPVVEALDADQAPEESDVPGLVLVMIPQ